MKKIVCLLCVVVLSFSMLCGCKWGKNVTELTPNRSAVQSIIIQKTYKNDDGKICYRQKVIDKDEDIDAIIKKLDSVGVERQEAVEYSYVDYLVLFEGPKDHRLVVSKDYYIYDGTAYTVTREKNKTVVANLYNTLNYTEEEASSRLFQ